MWSPESLFESLLRPFTYRWRGAEVANGGGKHSVEFTFIVISKLTTVLRIGIKLIVFVPKIRHFAHDDPNKTSTLQFWEFGGLHDSQEPQAHRVLLVATGGGGLGMLPGNQLPHGALC